MTEPAAAATLVAASASAIPVTLLDVAGLSRWRARESDRAKSWLAASGFGARAGEVCLLPGTSGVERVLFGADFADPWRWAQLADKLPAGLYRIDGKLAPAEASWAALAWTLAGYRFGRYKAGETRERAQLVWPAGADRAEVERLARAIHWVRDLVNTPAGDMGPGEIADAASMLARRHKAKLKVIRGEALLDENYPAVHTVGRAASRPPCLVDLTWGSPRAPKVTLVGKGVCFDSGGLDLKPSSNMRLMKKDMAGAAHALALGGAIMDAGMKVRLRVLAPAVENAVSGDAMHPLDVIKMRSGKTVEIGNTDAEGRLILADALAEADREKPALLIDFATLTGAARAALGPDLPALFTHDERLARGLLGAGAREHDPMWRMPLFGPYRKYLDSKFADISSTGESPFAGAITAALFLGEFVAPKTPWAHLDLFAWNPASRPGRPEGGEAMGLRAIYRMLEQRFG